MIIRLPPHLANQIAAGEVVQRPESVVKELIENALDAGAQHVSVIISQAGKTLINIIDDGFGMSEEDIPLAFERHATSKIASYEDLENIITFGFRGEALPSIASVAQIELKSRRTEDDLATFMRIDGGAVQEITKTQSDVGTSISIKNLFYNTPARRQYLKSNATEFKHITDSVHRFLLSYPHIGFTYISDGEAIYDVRPGTLKDRVKLILGNRIGDSMIEIQESTDELSVSGFIGRPNFAKKSRGDQYLFLNTRYIIHRALNHAILSAYEQMISSTEYPPYVMFLNVNPQEVDVNVHPAKLEVKLKNERGIYNLVHAIVRRGLYTHDLSPSMTFRPPSTDESFNKVRLTTPQEQTGQSSDIRSNLSQFDAGTEKRKSQSDQWSQPVSSRKEVENIDELFRSLGISNTQDRSSTPETASSSDRTIIFQSEKPISDIQFLWQLHNKYIFTPIKSGLMIIDQHVAHERILYERALSTMENTLPFAQQLLFPHSIRMVPGDYALVRELEQELHRLGFVLTLSPPNFVTVEAVPQDVRVGMEEHILEELLEQFKEYQQLGTTEIRDNIAKSYSCRAAIKAGDKLNSSEMQKLIDELFATQVPFVCPHGRPIIIKLSLQDIDLKFGRTS